MTDPARSADWHASRAVELADLARSTSMAGWWKRNRRRELLAEAQVHATLAATALNPAEFAASDRTVDDLERQLHATEHARDDLNVEVQQSRHRCALLDNELSQVRRALITAGMSAEEVRRLGVPAAVKKALDGVTVAGEEVSEPDPDNPWDDQPATAERD